MVHGVALTLALPQRPKALWCHGCLHSHVTYTVKALSPESKVDVVMPILNIMCWMLASPRLNLSYQSEQMSNVKQQLYNTVMVFVQLSS